MLESFGSALRAMREVAELSLSALASRANVSKGQIGNLERGARLPTVAIVEALDGALRAGGVLIQLAALERGGGDDMRRRALLATVGAAASLGTIGGPHALGDMVRHGLLDAAGTQEDWDAVVDDSRRRLVTDPSPLFGSALLTNLMVIQRQVTEQPGSDLWRAAAGLGQVYGLWLGNQAELGGANRWYGSATTFADRSGDVEMRTYTRGRSASRGIYEDWTIARTLDTAEAALALTSRPTLGALEAHAARVSVAALTGDPASGREAIRAMADLADQLPADRLRAGPHERTVFLDAFLECRVGTLPRAEAACDRAEAALAMLPTWLIEARVYRARAMVTAGEVLGGLAYALRTVAGLKHEVRVISVAVRDVVQSVPAGHRSCELDELRTYAATDPGPWETLR